MKFRRIALWAIIDVLGTSLGVALMSVHPINAKTDGVKPKAEYLIQAEWDIDRNIDVDLWVVGPSKKPIFYDSRQVGCADLDRDSLGYSTSDVILADGSKVRAKSNMETVTIRCIEPGRWNTGVNFFSTHGNDDLEPIKVHVEVTALNPSVRTVWGGNVELKRPGETINTVSFDLAPDGTLTLASTPLEPITRAYTSIQRHAVGSDQ